MHLPHESLRNPIEPGTTTTYDGQELIGIEKAPNRCNVCFFRSDDSGCDNTPCYGVVWMTPLAAITARLTT